MSDQVHRRLSAALQAQASGVVTTPPAAGTGRGPVPDREPARAKPDRLPAAAVLALAILLGAMAGGLAAVISYW
ncbi:MAG TPA: hypothetical protein VGL88_06180 [Pseudonocardiaceae bacterium]|jgi:hypothetical protein